MIWIRETRQRRQRKSIFATSLFILSLDRQRMALQPRYRGWHANLPAGR